MLKHFWCVIFLWWIVNYLFVQPCLLAQPVGSVGIDRKVTRLSPDKGLSMLRDTSGSVTIHQLLRRPDQYPFESIQSPVPMIGRDPIWYKLTVYNRDSVSLLRWIELDYAYLDEVTGYLVTQAGVRSLAPPFGWQTPVADRPIEHRNSLLPVTLPARQSAQVFLRIRRDLGMQRVAMTIWSPDDFNRHDLNERFMWGIITGWLILTVLSALFLYVINQERIYLYYALYTLAHLATLLTNEGLSGDYYMGMGTIVSGQLRNVFILIAMISNLLFVGQFLDARQHIPGWVFRVRQLVLGSSLLIIFPLVVWNKLSTFLSAEVINYVLTSTLFIGRALYLLMALLSFLFVVYSLSKRPLGAYLYLFAFLPLLLVTIVLLFGADTFLSRFAFFQMEFYAGAVLFEITVLLFGLAYRFKQYRDEREHLLREQNLLTQRTQVAERQRLGRDLHDGVGVDLAVLRMRLSTLADEERHSAAITAAVDDLDRISREVREVAHALIPADLKQGIKACLHQLVDRLSLVNPHLEINFTAEVNQSITPVVEQAVYAMAKELLNNSLKHAHATIIDVELYTQENHIYLRVSDDGVGYVSQPTTYSGGIGLRNIQATTNDMGGQFVVLQKPQGGIMSEVSVPITRLLVRG